MSLNYYIIGLIIAYRHYYVDNCYLFRIIIVSLKPRQISFRKTGNSTSTARKTESKGKIMAQESQKNLKRYGFENQEEVLDTDSSFTRRG
jgi:hypothetical protein